MPPRWFTLNAKMVLETLETQMVVNELKTLSNLKIELGPEDALSILATIQWALRPPKNVGRASQIAGEFARRLQDYLSVNDEIKQFCEKGWDSKCDVR